MIVDNIHPTYLLGVNSPPDDFSSLFRYGQQVNSTELEILPLLLFKTAKSAEQLDTILIKGRHFRSPVLGRDRY